MRQNEIKWEKISATGKESMDVCVLFPRKQGGRLSGCQKAECFPPTWPLLGESSRLQGSSCLAPASPDTAGSSAPSASIHTHYHSHLTHCFRCQTSSFQTAVQRCHILHTLIYISSLLWLKMEMTKKWSIFTISDFTIISYSLGIFQYNVWILVLGL